MSIKEDFSNRLHSQFSYSQPKSTVNRKENSSFKKKKKEEEEGRKKERKKNWGLGGVEEKRTTDRVLDAPIQCATPLARATGERHVGPI